MCRKLSEMKGSREVGGSSGSIDARGVDTIHWIGSWEAGREGKGWGIGKILLTGLAKVLMHTKRGPATSYQSKEGSTSQNVGVAQIILKFSKVLTLSLFRASPNNRQPSSWVACSGGRWKSKRLKMSNSGLSFLPWLPQKGSFFGIYS